MTLPLFASLAPSVTAEDAQPLIALLAGRGWQTARQLAQYGYGDRQLRALASASKGQIVGGQRGYALVREISDDEADHCEAFLLSQARAMTARAVEIRKARNRRAA